MEVIGLERENIFKKAGVTGWLEKTGCTDSRVAPKYQRLSNQGRAKANKLNGMELFIREETT